MQVPTDPSCNVALKAAPSGYQIESLRYSTRVGLGIALVSPGAISATHVAFTVADVH